MRLAISIAHVIVTRRSRLLEVLVGNDIHILLTHGDEVFVIAADLGIAVQLAHAEIDGLD